MYNLLITLPRCHRFTFLFLTCNNLARLVLSFHDFPYQTHFVLCSADSFFFSYKFGYLLFSIYWLLWEGSIFIFHGYCQLIIFISWLFPSIFTMFISSNYFKLVNWVFSYAYSFHGGLNSFARLLFNLKCVFFILLHPWTPHCCLLREALCSCVIQFTASLRVSTSRFIFLHSILLPWLLKACHPSILWIKYVYIVFVLFYCHLVVLYITPLSGYHFTPCAWEDVPLAFLCSSDSSWCSLAELNLVPNIVCSITFSLLTSKGRSGSEMAFFTPRKEGLGNMHMCPPFS